MKVQALIHEAEEGGYWAEVSAFPGCYSEGDTLEETVANIREAAELWLEGMADISMRHAKKSSAKVVELDL